MRRDRIVSLCVVQATLRAVLASCIVAATLSVVGCGDESDDGEGGNGGGAGGSSAHEFQCGIPKAAPNEGWTHVATDSAVSYTNNPPASGPHYPVWTKFQAYTSPVPRGYWVHSVEHGAVVMLYRPDADAANVASFKAAYDALPEDTKCGHARAVFTSDPELDVDFAVVAADIVLEPTCIDAQDVALFVQKYRGKAPEDECAQGAYDGT